MIKNILFDMGDVLIDFDSWNTAREYTKDKVMQDRIVNAICFSSEWVHLDIGYMSEEEALEKMTKRLKTEEEKGLARLYFQNWERFNMRPKEGMADLIHSLKEKGYKLYILSNAPKRILKVYKDLIPAIDCFDDVIFSAVVGYIKPQKDIYYTAYRQFAIEPGESFFIDDLSINIAGAKETGMDGYCFADGDMEKLKERLKLALL